MKKMKVVTLVALILTFAFIVSGCSQGSTIGVLDVNKVMAESAKVKGYQDQLNQKGQDLTKQLEAEKASLSAEQYQAKQEAAYKEFLQTKQDMEKQIDDSIKQATDQVAKSKKLGAILYKNGVAQGGTDVTQDVINQMK